MDVSAQANTAGCGGQRTRCASKGRSTLVSVGQAPACHRPTPSFRPAHAACETSNLVGTAMGRNMAYCDACGGSHVFDFMPARKSGETAYSCSSIVTRHLKELDHLPRSRNSVWQKHRFLRLLVVDGHAKLSLTRRNWTALIAENDPARTNMRHGQPRAIDEQRCSNGCRITGVKHVSE